MQEFVHQPGGTGVTQVQITKLSWAEECVDDDDDKPIGKIIELPTAPRAARLLQDDCVPANAPFVAYLSNLPYDVEDSEIERFFDTLNVVNIRLPRDDGDSGKSRGYGYVEFEAREDLIDALSIPDPMINGRRIKIDLTSDNDGQGRGNRRNNRYGNDSYNSGDRNTNWRDRQDGGFSGGRDNYEGGRRNNNYGNRRDRDPVSVDASEAGSWRTGDRPKYSPPAERKQYDRPGRPDRDRFGGRRRNDFQGPPGEEDLPSERPKLNLKPRTLPMPELSFPKEEEIPVIFKGKPNGDVEHPPKSLSVEQDDIDGSNEEHEDIDDIHEEHNGEDIERPEKISSPKPRGVPSAKVFGDAKPVDTAAKEREIEEKLAQRERDQKLKTDDEKKRLAEVNENENVKEEELNKTEDENRENPVREIPRSIEPVKSWRDKDGDDGRPRNKNYSPERDSRGPPRDRRHGKFLNSNLFFNFKIFMIQFKNSFAFR